ncbi:MAG: hydrogenase formation protein HypD [Pseudomonadota bacterium]
MKYIDEYRDGTVSRGLSLKIKEASKKPVRLMEICGTHTMSIFKHGLRSLLPETIDLVSGPGCPVCVTAMEEIDKSVKLARTPGVIVATFGDMLRVPGTASSLDEEKAKGADVRVVYSTLDALKIAGDATPREVVFLGIGFETTAPTVATAIKTARKNQWFNFSVLSAHKLLPPAMEALLSGGDLDIDGFICPGHVTTIIGTSAYEEIASRYHIPCVVVGFEPIDILQGILMLVEQIEAGRADVEIQYVRGASPEGNPGALRVMREVFEPCDSPWRGLGKIPGSGLAIRDSFSTLDAKTRFDLDVPPAKEPPGCRCAEILRGTARPPDCQLFRRTCSPRNPVGACMVSSEGTCAAYFKYHNE